MDACNVKINLRLFGMASLLLVSTVISYAQKAKECCDNHPEQTKLISVFSWNERIEGVYLLPDRNMDLHIWRR
jgi:hypothetical protein